jgi:hypothetical protein
MRGLELEEPSSTTYSGILRIIRLIVPSIASLLWPDMRSEHVLVWLEID